MSRAVPRRCLMLLLVALISALALRPGLAQPAKGKMYALLVGVSEYDSVHFPRLRFTENDVEKLAVELQKPGSGFAAVRVLTTTRGKKDPRDAPTAANIRQALGSLLAGKSRHDLVLVALSGHGIELSVKDPDGEKEPKTYGYFCPADARLTGVRYSTGHSKDLIHLNDLFEQIGRCDAGSKLVLMDACRNEMEVKAATGSVDLRKVTVPAGVGALFSCKPGQKSFETADLKHGVFFHFVLEGLRGQARNERKEVTWSRLVEYVTEKVRDEVGTLVGGGARQTPHPLGNIPGKSPVLVRPEDEVVERPKGKWPKEVTNSIGMKLVRIPAGKFLMSSTEEEREAVRKIIGEKKQPDWLKAEGPQHEVEISREFWLGMHEVTQKQYRTVIGKNPSHFCADGGGKDKVKGVDTDDFPVETVSHDEAVEFCRKLSALAKEQAAGRVYRLPSEAEWEYACRGGASTYHVFHFGNSLSSTQANFDGNFPYGGAAKGPFLDRPVAVNARGYGANAFGLYHMHGNVGEWCADRYDPDYYKSSPRRDPPGPSEGSFRVVRGGSWYDLGGRCRSADRHWDTPGIRNGYVGFRAALVPSGEKR